MRPPLGVGVGGRCVSVGGTGVGAGEMGVSVSGGGGVSVGMGGRAEFGQTINFQPQKYSLSRCRKVNSESVVKMLLEFGFVVAVVTPAIDEDPTCSVRIRSRL